MRLRRLRSDTRQVRLTSRSYSPSEPEPFGDVRPGSPAQWNTVFIADVTPPEERKKGILGRSSV